MKYKQNYNINNMQISLAALMWSAGTTRTCTVDEDHLLPGGGRSSTACLAGVTQLSFLLSAAIKR